MGWISAVPRVIVPAAALLVSLTAGQIRAATDPIPSRAPASAAGQPAPSRNDTTNPAASRSKAAHTTMPAGAKTKPKQKPGEVMELDWRSLLPESERAHYSESAPPPEHGPLGEGGPPAVQKLTGTFNPDLADVMVRLPGFVVPIGAPREGLITEFFLVPYIGACIHVPPPPPNQMVYVTSTGGIPADATHEAYWVTGKMRIETRTTPLGVAAYAVSAAKVELYAY